MFLKSGINLLIDIKFSPACGITKAPEFNSDSNATPFASVPNSCAYINARPLVTPDISVAGNNGLIGVVELVGRDELNEDWELNSDDLWEKKQEEMDI